MNTPRLGVVIQGPLTSAGITARQRRRALELGRVVDSTVFDARANIKTIFDQTQSANWPSVLVTWASEGAFQGIPKSNILVLPDPNQVAPRVTLRKPMRSNRYRQFLSSMAGVQALAALGCNLVLKVRTDQSLAIRIAGEFLIQACAGGEPDRVFVPSISRLDPRMIGDFYQGGRIEVLEAAYSLLSRKFGVGFNNDVHLDIFYQLAWEWSGKPSGDRLSEYIPLSAERVSPAQISRIKRDLLKCFRPFPREVWMSLSWRGEPVHEADPSLAAESVFADDGESGLVAALTEWANSIPNSSGNAGVDLARYGQFAHGPVLKNLTLGLGFAQQALAIAKGRALRAIDRQGGWATL